MISSTLTVRLQEQEKKKKKSGHCHPGSLSSVNSLYKLHKRKDSQNDVAKKEEKKKQARWNILL